MLGSSILDVAIGMAFIYLLLSLIVTAANELIAAWAGARGKHLIAGIASLLSGDLVAEVYQHPLVKSLSASGKLPSYIPSRTFALALLDTISGGNGKLPTAVAGVQAMIDNLPDSELKKSLNVLLSEAGNDVEKFKTGVEVWFNNSMDRVSGWYKRKTQYVLFGLALGVTCVFNVDSIGLANRLSHDVSLRAALVSRAEAAAKKTVPTANSTEADIRRANDDLDAATDRLRELELPIGWTNNPFGGTDPLLWRIVRPIGGWLLTTLAISLGAPFWFDILNKIINVRNTGKAPEEEAKDPKKVPQPAGPGQQPAL